MSFINLELAKDKPNHLIMTAEGMDSITFTFPDAKNAEEKFCWYV